MDSIRNWLLICDVNIHVTVYFILIHLLTIGPSLPFSAKLVVDFLKIQCQVCTNSFLVSFFQLLILYNNNLSAYYFTFLGQLLVLCPFHHIHHDTESLLFSNYTNGTSEKWQISDQNLHINDHFWFGDHWQLIYGLLLHDQIWSYSSLLCGH